jgi:hypothetical protein
MESDSHRPEAAAAAATEGPSDAVSLNARLKSIGLKESYASHLATGRRTPSLDLALEIEARLGIEPRFWKERPDLARAPAMASGGAR